MENLHLPDNIKVHFAGGENSRTAFTLKEMGVSYVLYSAFKEVHKKVYGKKKNETIDENPLFLNNNFKHVIQDSGLFSLLFGALKGQATKEDIYKWYDALVEYTIEHSQKVTCVEVDAQAIIGVDETWNLRERMRRDLPNNRIINVFHLQDGKDGLDRLIEFSDYIAIGAPELRTFNMFQYVYPLAKYVKEKKPEIDIHLLGCTDSKMINRCSWCSSCDSSFYLHPVRYGHLMREKVSGLDKEKIIKMIGEDRFKAINNKAEGTEETNLILCASIEKEKRLYEIYAGNQDYAFL